MNKKVDLRELAIDRGGADQPQLRTRRHLITRYVLPLVLIVCFLSLLAWATRDFLFPPQPVTVMPVVFTTAELQKEGTPLFKAAGWVEPRPTPVRVAALASGVVKQLLVVEDQAVKAGEPIAKLIRDDADLAYQRALADLELRHAELDEANAGLAAANTRYQQPVHLQATLGEAEAALARIETQLKNLPFEVRRAEADHEAVTNVYTGKRAASGVVPGIEIDIAEGKLTSAKALVEELRNRSELLEKELLALRLRRDALNTQLELRTEETKTRDEAIAKVRGAEARVVQARVAAAQAKLQLDRMTVISPVDGRVYRLIAHPGARIGGITQMSEHDGSTVVTLYHPDMLQVRVDVRFEDVPKVSLGQPVEIGNAAIPSPLTGNVLYISSEADIQKNTLQVKVEIPNPPEVFRPEMLVDVTFVSPGSQASPDRQESKENSTGTLATRILVPERLVWQEGDVAFIWLADQSESIARKQKLQTGSRAENGLIEVTQGLNVSSRIIVTGRENLTDGCRIYVTGES